MCPGCLAAISWMVAGVVSSGGVAALAVTALRARSVTEEEVAGGVVEGDEEFPSLNEKEKKQ